MRSNLLEISKNKVFGEGDWFKNPTLKAYFLTIYLFDSV